MEDKMKGLLLALSSTILIGSSFIVKKKGLRKAASTGVRAGEKSALGEHTVQGCLQGRECGLDPPTVAEAMNGTT